MTPESGATRRALLGATAAAGALALAGCGSGPPPRDPLKHLAPGVAQSDIQLLGALLELERRTVAAYIAGIPLLDRPHAHAAQQFLNEELQHTGQLIALINGLGGRQSPRATSYDIGHPSDDAEVLALLHSLEALQIAGYLRAIPRLAPGPVRSAVASILTVDAQHISMLRLAQGQDPVPSPFVTGAQ